MSLSLKNGDNIAIIKGRSFNRKVLKINKDKNNNNCKSLQCNDSEIIPLPRILESGCERGFVAGATGAGKSTYVSKYIFLYQNMNKKNPVWVFSRLDSDNKIDALGVYRIDLKNFILNPMTISEFKKDGDGALFIFDDIDTIPDKKINIEIN